MARSEGSQRICKASIHSNGHQMEKDYSMKMISLERGYSFMEEYFMLLIWKEETLKFHIEV
jgi:hypothetical protein